jgi:hypothetical protein
MKYTTKDGRWRFLDSHDAGMPPREFHELLNEVTARYAWSPREAMVEKRDAHKRVSGRPNRRSQVAVVTATVRLGPKSLLKCLRRSGWRVGAHNDFFLERDKEWRTFWMFTHRETGRYIEAEGQSDSEAIWNASGRSGR